MGHNPVGKNDAPLIIELEGDLLRFGLKYEQWMAQIASYTDVEKPSAAIDVTVLPYANSALQKIESARKEGMQVILNANTNVDQDLTRRIAVHLNLFDHVQFAMQQPLAPVTIPIANTLKNWAQALRLHQWVKNCLIFVPLVAAHRLTDVTLLAQGMLAFLCFGLCASSVYILNDLLDLTDDRHHKAKRHRPFASGALAIRSGLIAFPMLLVLAFSLALISLPWTFAAVLGTYYVLTLLYSLLLKRLMALDVIALAMLYTLRVFAGGAALQLTLTFWLLAFAMFLFLSLALAKRFAELRDALERGRTGKTRGRDYDPHDLEMIASLGAAAGYQSVMVLALYLREQSTITLYANPDIMWLACPILLFWITRVWMLTHRGQMHEDPVVFAARDWISQIAGVLFGLTFLAAS